MKSFVNVNDGDKLSGDHFPLVMESGVHLQIQWVNILIRSNLESRNSALSTLVGGLCKLECDANSVCNTSLPYTNLEIIMNTWGYKYMF